MKNEKLKSKNIRNIYRPKLTLALKRQKGFTLIELTAAVVIIGAVIGAALGGRYLLAWYNGKNEGELMANALNCARATWTGSNFNGITLRTMVDNSCFPADRSSNKGTPTASANNAFSTPYRITATQINTPNDAVKVTSDNLPSGSCPSAIQAANTTAGTIQVISNGTTTQVKAPGSPVDDSKVSAACGSSTLVTLVVAATKSGN
jgi:prepilin-type N-terminal cleavage/methylation domain-containing protein